MIPYFEGRVGYGLDQLGARTADEDYEGLRKSMPKRPYRLLQDVLGRHGGVRQPRGDRMRPEVLRRGSGGVRVGRARSIPKGGPLYIRETIRVIDSLEITPEARRKIYQGNAERLFKRAF